MPSLNSALVFSLLLASATAFQGGLQHRSRLPYHATAVFMPRAGRMASVVRRAEAEAEAEAMDLDLEEMFDIFERGVCMKVSVAVCPSTPNWPLKSTIFSRKLLAAKAAPLGNMRPSTCT